MVTALTVVAEPLSALAFAPYGDVVSAGASDGKSANLGTALRFDQVASLVSTRPAAKANVAVFRSLARSLPYEVKMLERHPCSSQMFVPMRCSTLLVVVCPADAVGEPDLARLQAFVCAAGQGFNYKPGVWHHPIIALDAPAELVMLAWEDGGARDCEERLLASPARVSL